MKYKRDFTFSKIIINVFLLVQLLNNELIDYKNNNIEKGTYLNKFINNTTIENKTKIDISYSCDNKFIYPTIVSMTSLVINADFNTFYNIYILHTPDFTEYSKKCLKTVETIYYDKCTIIFFNMGDKYNNLTIIDRLSIASYYRLSLQDLLPNVDKIIYLDGDTLVFGDLKELIYYIIKST